jgi:hypothetical protein
MIADMAVTSGVGAAAAPAPDRAALVAVTVTTCGVLYVPAMPIAMLVMVWAYFADGLLNLIINRDPEPPTFGPVQQLAVVALLACGFAAVATSAVVLKLALRRVRSYWSAAGLGAGSALAGGTASAAVGFAFYRFLS